MPRIALLGSTGYVGSEFASQIEQRGHTLLRVERAECDIFDQHQLRTKLETVAPNFLVNCAGYTGKPNVDACEQDKTACLAGNAVLPGVIAQACDELGLAWGHVSSGCIFTGSKPDRTGFLENDPPNFSFRQNNCSFYSGTKALGEELLADEDRCYIWRLRIPFSNQDTPRNYLSKLMRYDRLLEAENSLSNLPEFVAACLDCFEHDVPFGVYNLTNPGRVTTKEVVAMIRTAGITDKTFKFFDSEAEFMRVAAKTPRSNCVLDSTKALAAGLRLTPIRESIEQALQTWSGERREASSESTFRSRFSLLL